MSAQLSSSSLVCLSPLSASDGERRLLEGLAERLRAGDTAWIERVLRELVPEVRRWMFRLLGPGHFELEDATQDALAEIASALHRFQGRSSVSTLAHRITVRTAYRYYGRGKPHVVRGREIVDELDPERDASARESLARLFVHLDRLVSSRRTAFVLCAIEGLLPHEAAEVMGTSSNAVRSLLCRAREQIEGWIREEQSGGQR